ncbi:polysaccharide pyruvyl transferase family protein, partial [Enterococcus faecium]|nr:polysaccharide pyruvyl transferase family protein [Enterococcus faecium]
VLVKKGYEVQTIKNLFQSDMPQKRNLVKKAFCAIKNGNLESKIKNRKLNRIRTNKFVNFTKKWIYESEDMITSLDQGINIDNDFDFYIIGSDQVWNYTFSRFSELDFVSYSNKPKISYAASFGVTFVPDKQKNFFIEGLNNIDFISVREEAGKKIVEELSDKKATVVLDPTMLLDKEEWGKLSKESNFDTNFSYVLTYFLGEFTIEYKKYVEKYAKEKKVKIINIGDISDRKTWLADPSDFVKLFENAQAVFTDSFHACVFSIIFEKYFEVFERQSTLLSMNSRIDTLLTSLSIEDRWNRGGDSHKKEINYSEVKKLLEYKKKESMDFLDSALKGIVL